MSLMIKALRTSEEVTINVKGYRDIPSSKRVSKVPALLVKQFYAENFKVI